MHLPQSEILIVHKKYQVRATAAKSRLVSILGTEIKVIKMGSKTFY
jgi:hypothetical protein